MTGVVQTSRTSVLRLLLTTYVLTVVTEFLRAWRYLGDSLSTSRGESGEKQVAFFSFLGLRKHENMTLSQVPTRGA